MISHKEYQSIKQPVNEPYNNKYLEVIESYNGVIKNASDDMISYIKNFINTIKEYFDKYNEKKILSETIKYLNYLFSNCEQWLDEDEDINDNTGVDLNVIEMFISFDSKNELIDYINTN